jgi:CRP-like cAMP-binding protein
VTTEEVPMTDEIQTTKRDALAASVFGGLKPAQLDEIARVSESRYVPEGSHLCDQGDFGNEAFVIAEGSVAIEISDRQVGIAGPGALLGDWAMFGSGHRTATLRALTPVTVVVVDPLDVDALAAAVPGSASRLGPVTA